MADLAALQRAFHDACTGEALLESGRALVRDDGVDPVRRLRAYAHAYWARIAGVLATDYPKLRALLGDAAFDALVIPYLRAYPTRHPSLREAGVHLARFLDEQPAHADLARLERARIEVFDGPDARPLSRDDVAALPPEEFPLLRLRLVPSSALVELATNADDVWDAIEDGRPLPAPAPAARTVLVWRRGTTAIHRTLEPDEAGAIRRMAPGAFGPVAREPRTPTLPPPPEPRCAGATFAELCEEQAGRAAGVERALELLLRWLDAEVLVADP